MVAVLLGILGCSSGTTKEPAEDDDTRAEPTAIEPVPETETTDTAAPPVVLGDSVVESFPYAAPKVDVLFVIDASTSMIGNTETLIGALDSLVATWLERGIDFHAGVTDIDESAIQGELLQVAGYRWADPAVPYPGELLRELVDAVPDPSTNEQGRAAAYKALQLTDAGEVNEGFLRAEAELAVIVHSDESDQSGAVPISEEDFVAWFLALRGPGRASVHAIVATEDYYGLAGATSGVAWSVTNTPYGPVLDAITTSFDRYNTFVLAGDPLPETLTARVVLPSGGEEIVDHDELVWVPETGTVDLLDYYPEDGATVEISYVPVDGD